MTSQPEPGKSSPGSSGDGRLESWKEIAAHFNRTVRAVQLWETQHQMPVHRPSHGKLGMVYAYSAELDAWFSNGRSLPGLDAANGRARRRRLLLAVAAAAVVLVGLSTWHNRERFGLAGEGRASAPSEATGIVLRHSPEPERYRLLGNPGADGRYLPFSDLNGELAIFEIATGETRLLTHKGSWEESDDFAYFTAVSPDSERIAFAWYSDAEKRMDLRVIGIDGSEPRVVYADEDIDSIEFVDWAGHGEQILAGIVTGDGATELTLIVVEDGSTRVIKTLEQVFPSGMSLSPDGRYLAYARPVSEAAPNRDIFLVDSLSGEEIPLVQHPANDVTPLWTADGSTIVFGSDRAGTLGVWTLGVQEGRPMGVPRLVRKGIGRSWLTSLTRDGSLYYGFQAGMAEVYVAALDPLTSRVVEEPAVVGDSFLGASLFCDWSPSGRYLAYVSERGYVRGAPGFRKLVVRNMDTAEERVLSPALSWYGKPRWSLDEASIFV